MQLSHTPQAMSATFDEANLVSSAGLVPVLGLAQQAGLRQLGDAWLTVPTDKGANAGLKICSLVAGMAAGADSIDDMALLRHGGMDRLFADAYAPSTLGSFLRTFTFGHVRQLDAVASRLLAALAAQTPLLAGIDDPDKAVFVDIDDTIKEVFGHTKQGVGHGYSGVRGLNALLATITSRCAPVIIAQRLRRGKVSSPRGAKRLVADALATVTKLRSNTRGEVVLRADSAFYGYPTLSAAVAAGVKVSVTMKLDAKVKAAIAAIADDAWQRIDYPNPVYDEQTKQWVSRAEVAEVPFTAFTSKSKNKRTPIPGRIIVRRIPDLNPKERDGQATLFDIWRFHPFFTTRDADVDTITADVDHRGHAVIEQVNADLKNSALAHLPSASFAANAAWLVCAVMAFNLTRAAATTTGPRLAKATTPTIRAKIINVPARIASSARRIRLHLPRNWPWRTDWNTLFTSIHDPPRTALTP